ncbi:glycerate kinase type-2 family protein [Lignipirellula cremea]|uniref:Hydroxypyruvate reductase n=1 Tax=Lignipirellula cremea TaxID=2528010 RepID=A0A518E2C9_9BACT|nr:DUF4147 domain-containing protein [Lignipirellula cremea]QDU98224.1 Putative hydroxypyruvate reductase [Lignipirellula cremea]
MQPRSLQQLRDDAWAIWSAGLEAVRSDRLVREAVQVLEGDLYIGDACLPLAEIDRILVVGAGKAGAGMAAGLEEALGPQLLKEKQVAGWINVPDDCVRPLTQLHLHGARPAGQNEPTAAGVAGTRRILELVQSAGPRDLCLCLISGGGSALLPAPVPGVSIEDKQSVTRFLSGAGANIEELNTVRKQLSLVKGGGLLRACQAGRLITLLISDVIGDPLDVIASGPTVENTTTAADALGVLEKFQARQHGLPASLFQALEQAAASAPPAVRTQSATLVIGNNAAAVDAAGVEAERRGYSHAMTAATQLEGAAEEIGVRLAQLAVSMRTQNGPDCLITGGEPIVHLVPAAERGRGGRNQQLVLAALAEMQTTANGLEGIVLLSGGTDGEDGPTDAAGAVVDARIAARAQQLQLSPDDYLRRNDAWRFFAPIDGLLKTGPTDTNVCDIRVVVVDRRQERT